MSSSNINDLQSLADELLTLKASILPTETKIEELKEVFSVATTRAGEALRFSSIKGMIETRNGSNTPDSTKLSVNPEAFQRLTPEMQAQLKLAGVVFDERVKGRVSKPAVSIKPVMAQKAAA